jgi:hypothetical protein
MVFHSRLLKVQRLKQPDSPLEALRYSEIPAQQGSAAKIDHNEIDFE